MQHPQPPRRVLFIEFFTFQRYSEIFNFMGDYGVLVLFIGAFIYFKFIFWFIGLFGDE